MSQVCRGPVCPAASQSAWWNWNWITKLTKYLVERDEEMGMDPTSACAREDVAPLILWLHPASLEEHHWLWSYTCFSSAQPAEAISPIVCCTFVHRVDELVFLG